MDLGFVKQQLPDSRGIMVHDVPMTVGADMTLMKVDFASSHRGITVLQIYPAFAQGFDFGALKHDACLVSLLNKIIVKRLAVRGHDFFGGVGARCHDVLGSPSS
jgi:hypothetical protein